MGEEDTSPSLERERTVETAWIFDVDGVITDPRKKRVTKPEILDYIAGKLELREPVAFNTGRSIPWVIDRVINPLLDIIHDKSVLKNLFAVGEKGGTWLTFSEDGTMQHHKDDSISVPQSLQERVEKLTKTEFSDSMFYDKTKKTMITVEMNDGYDDVEKYRERQHTLNEKLQELVEQENLGQQLKVDPTTIATDIENRHVGKDFAAERIHNWLQSNRIKPRKTFAFGDSPSDIPMAEKFYELGYNVEFIYVGKNELPKAKDNYPFPVTPTKNPYGKGTLEQLETV